MGSEINYITTEIFDNIIDELSLHIEYNNYILFKHCWKSNKKIIKMNPDYFDVDCFHELLSETNIFETDDNFIKYFIEVIPTDIEDILECYLLKSPKLYMIKYIIKRFNINPYYEYNKYMMSRYYMAFCATKQFDIANWLKNKFMFQKRHLIVNGIKYELYIGCVRETIEIAIQHNYYDIVKCLPYVRYDDSYKYKVDFFKYSQNERMTSLLKKVSWMKKFLRITPDENKILRRYDFDLNYNETRISHNNFMY